MQSLRTRKPTEGQPKPTQRQGSTRRPNPAARDPSRRATRVGEKMKKRMSMRYADISAPTGGMIPDVPSLPMSLRAGPYRNQGQEEQMLTEEPSEDPLTAELKLLDQDTFDPDACECARS